jgi:hypothetical protein
METPHAPCPAEQQSAALCSADLPLVPLAPRKTSHGCRWIAKPRPGDSQPQYIPANCLACGGKYNPHVPRETGPAITSPLLRIAQSATQQDRAAPQYFGWLRLSRILLANSGDQSKSTPDINLKMRPKFGPMPANWANQVSSISAIELCGDIWSFRWIDLRGDGPIIPAQT